MWHKTKPSKHVCHRPALDLGGPWFQGTSPRGNRVVPRGRGGLLRAQGYGSELGLSCSRSTIATLDQDYVAGIGAVQAKKKSNFNYYA